MRRNSSQTPACSAPPTARATATYHLRPFGRPLIEVYFGGGCACDLEAQGERAFFDFAVSELDRPPRRRFRPPHQTDPHASLGRRSVRARLLFVCAAGHGGLPRHAGGAGRRPPVLRRRGLLARRLLDRAWRLVHRRSGRRASHCRAARPRMRRNNALPIAAAGARIKTTLFQLLVIDQCRPCGNAI